MTLRDDRRRWNLRYRENALQAERPEPHPMALAWRPLRIGGAMLDAACGLGRGLASVEAGEFSPVYAVDLSEEAIAQARRLWSGRAIRWIVGDVAALAWRPGSFGLVTAFGFTDMRFFRQVPAMLRPGGMFLYEGFSARQLEVKPDLNPDWIGRPEALRALFAEGRVLELVEAEEPPFRVRMAALAPEAR